MPGFLLNFMKPSPVGVAPPPLALEFPPNRISSRIVFQLMRSSQRRCDGNDVAIDRCCAGDKQAIGAIRKVGRGVAGSGKGRHYSDVGYTIRAQPLQSDRSEGRRDGDAVISTAQDERGWRRCDVGEREDFYLVRHDASHIKKGRR
jgi:hypothetical protein